MDLVRAGAVIIAAVGVELVRAARAKPRGLEQQWAGEWDFNVVNEAVIRARAPVFIQTISSCTGSQRTVRPA